MRPLNITFEAPTLEINGIRYDVLRSDATIIQDLLNIDKRFEGVDMGDVKNVLLKNEAMLDYLDTLLGKGARKKITESVPGLKMYGLGMAGIDQLMTEIAKAAGTAYAESIKLKYED